MHYVDSRKKINFSLLAFTVLLPAIVFAIFGTFNSFAQTNNRQPKQKSKLSLPNRQTDSLLEVLAAGDLDPTFGTGGKLTTQIGSSKSEALAVALQADGKFVASGYSANNVNTDFALARYNANGTLDTTFGTGGKVVTDFGSADNVSLALAIQPADGKLVAAGCSSNGADDDFALVRYNPDGSLDATFGAGGIVTTNFNNSTDCINAVAVQSDGKIVAAGYYFNGSYFRFALARYNTNGTLDDTFGTGGKVMTRFTNLDDLAWAIIIQTDGKIIAAGEADTDFAVARYNTDGSLDATFDVDGKVRTSLVKFDSAYGAALQTDGKILAAGESGSGTNSDFAAVRYNSDGSLDASFDGDGIAVISVGAGDEFATSVAIDTSGKIVLGGFSSNGANDDFAVVRLNAGGTLDSSFGSGGGKVLTDFGGGSFDYISAVAASAGRIIAVGSAGANFAAAAYSAPTSGGCTYTLMPGSADFPAAGGSGSFTLTVAGGGAGCTYTAVSNDSFVTIMGGASGADSGTVSYSVAASNVSSPRVATITAGGQTFTINQARFKSYKRIRILF